ncbi:uncharacterized protein LOC126992473 [Eriocheir sinensis]|uniref:uncharacterized protein LOC126992473 n=1 Tax=Eriocheir sinensis TaxID=95602 RepID=UPI0021C82865|nr:uncharacterized protein LOC126992473 [Eriocheir sinensis]
MSCYIPRLYREKAAIIKGTFSDNGCSAEAKAKAWGSIVSRLAALHPGFSRCIKQCQRRWQTVMQEAKAKISAYQKARNGTGGLPPTLGELEVIIADVLGEGNVSVNSIDRTVVDPFPLDTEDVPENGSLQVDVTPPVPPQPSTDTPQTTTTPPPVVPAAAASSSTPVGTCTMLVDEEELQFIRLKRELELQAAELQVEIKQAELKKT